MASLPAIAEPPAAEELIQAIAQRRDRAAFGVLFDLYAPRIKAFYRRGGLDRPIAEELVQEVMLTVWQRAADYDEALGSLATWLFTIARNRRTDYLRREQRRQGELSDPSLQIEPTPGAEALVERAQQHISLRAAIETLPDEQAELLRLAFFEHMSHSRIASERALPLGTVKSRIRLALQRLREGLQAKR
jgi:RNA polymerase sigma-70 factor (ECF subfamily)